MYPTQLPPIAAGQAVLGLVCHRRLSPAVSATIPSPSLASSGTSLLTRSEESNSRWQRGTRPEPQTDTSGGGGGHGPRKRVGYSGDGGHEEHGSGGLRLPWDRLFGLGAGVHARLEADPSVLSRLGRDCCLDLLAILAVSLGRQNRLWREADLVVSQVCVALLCDCALAYLMAPAAEPLLHPRAGSTIRVPLAQRVAYFAAKTVQCAGVGFVMGCIGSGLVSAGAAVRNRVDDRVDLPARQQAVAKTGLGWLCYMGLSSNMRVSALQAAEGRLHARFPGVKSRWLVVALRMGNSFLGAHAWIALEEALGLNRFCIAKQRNAEGGLLAGA